MAQERNRDPVRQLWSALPTLGVDASKQHALRVATHRLGLRDDVQVRAFDQIDAIVKQSEGLLSSLQVDESRGPVLVWAVRGGLLVNITEALLAHALRLRSADTLTFISDAALPACEAKGIVLYPDLTYSEAASKRICDRCFFTSRNVFERFRLPHAYLGAYMTPHALDEARAKASSMTPEQIFDLTYKGVHIGPLIESSVVRFFQRVDLDDNAETEETIKRYATAALIIADISERVLAELKPRALLTSHGVYVTWGIITEMAKKLGVPVTVWARGYRKSSLILARGTTYFEEMLDEPSSIWEALDLTEVQRRALDEYLANRWGAADTMSIESVITEGREIVAQLELDSSKPTLTLFPNIPWDAQVHYRNVAFPNILQWIAETICFFEERPGWQLVVRAHPLEAWLSKGTPTTVDEITRRFPTLPPNVRVVSAESSINSYALAEMTDAVAVHATQFGLEMAARGKPVIVTGGPPYRGRGFTFDPETRQEYFELLSRLEEFPLPTGDQVDRARKYAYHLYFRRQIPFPFVEEKGRDGFERFRIESLHDLLPGCNRHLDEIARGILEDQSVLVDI